MNSKYSHTKLSSYCILWIEVGVYAKVRGVIVLNNNGRHPQNWMAEILSDRLSVETCF